IRFREYYSNHIDIDLSCSQIQLTLIVSKRFGSLISYTGMSFLYYMDTYREAATGEKESEDISLFSPVIGCKLNITDFLYVAPEIMMLGEKGFSFNIGLDI
ncbi:hypothetical protein ACFLTD_03105, partial [Elusimicrobiota bacterium]